MIALRNQVTFPDAQSQRQALGYLAARFACRSFDNGMTLIPCRALGPMAAHGIRFTVHGLARYSQFKPPPRDSQLTTE